MTIESHILNVIEGKKRAPVTKMLLRAMSHCYKAGSYVHHFAYDMVIPQTRLKIPVISIGNIVAGGTGKTPLVHYLAQAIGPEKVAILSRGYRRKSHQTLVVKPMTSVEECGDEPLLLAKKLPDAQIIVGSDRAYSGRLAQKMGAEYILLDDGMQHRRLHRDIEIGVMDGHNLFGGGYFIPRGLLRDHPNRLKKTDLIILNGVKDEAHFHKLSAEIGRYTQTPITVMQLSVENSTEIASKKVAAFCAIAAPYRFIQTLKTLGCDIVLQQEQGDHLSFSATELERLSNQARDLGAECLVCTEKDAVKLPEHLICSLPIVPVKIALTPTFGKEHLDNILKRFNS